MTEGAGVEASRRRASYEALFAEQVASGLSLKAFAESKGIKPCTLYAWSRKLRRGGTGLRAAKTELAPVRLVPEEASVGDGGNHVGGPMFEVEVGGRRVIRVAPGFDAGELRRLLSVVESRC